MVGQNRSVGVHTPIFYAARGMTGPKCAAIK
jgi:hypothetical protein